MMEETVTKDKEKNLQLAMSIIVDAGNAKALAVKAIKEAKMGNQDTAQATLRKARDVLTDAHNAQTEMLMQEAQENYDVVTLLTVHSQDHLMTAITYCDLAADFIDIYNKLNKF